MSAQTTTPAEKRRRREITNPCSEQALDNAIASYKRNREIWLRAKAKEIREQREAAAACSSA